MIPRLVLALFAAALVSSSGCCAAAECRGVEDDGGSKQFTVTLEVSSAPADGMGSVPMPERSDLIPGAQGGFHIWLNYKVSGAPQGSKVRIKQTARRTMDGKLMSQGERVFTLDTLSGEGAWQTPSALPAFMCPTPIGLSVVDQALDFHFDVFDEAGVKVGEAAQHTTAVCPQTDQLAFCQRICTG